MYRLVNQKPESTDLRAEESSSESLLERLRNNKESFIIDDSCEEQQSIETRKLPTNKYISSQSDDTSSQLIQIRNTIL